MLTAVPEPDLVFYGHVTRSPHVPLDVRWSLSGKAEGLAVSQRAVVSVNSPTFFHTRIPFGSR
jgi:hypothetical protein